MLLLTTAFWGLSFPIVKALNLIQSDLLPENSSWFHASLTAVVRFGCAAFVLLLVCARSLRKLTRLEISQGVGIGLFGGAGVLLQMDGIAYTAASTSAFLTLSFCIWVPIVVAIRDRCLPNRKVVVTVLLMCIGVAVLTDFNFRTFRLGRGELETLISALFFAGQILWLDRDVYRHNNPGHFSMVMFLVMALLALPILAATTRSRSDLIVCYSQGSVLVLASALIIFCTLGAFIMMNRWQPFVSATEASIIYGGEPVLASLFALFLPGVISSYAGLHYPNETITPQLFIGGAFIVGANLFLQLGWLKSPPASAV